MRTRAILEDTLAIATGLREVAPVGDEGDWPLGNTVDYAIECRGVAGGAVDCGAEAASATARLEWAWWRDGPILYREQEWASDWSLDALATAAPTLDGTGRWEEAEELPFDPLAEGTFYGSTELRATFEGVSWSAAGRTLDGGTVRYEYAEGSVTEVGDEPTESADRAAAEATFVAEGVARIVVDGLDAFRFDLATSSLTAEP